MLRVVGVEVTGGQGDGAGALPPQVTDSGHYECVATSSVGETRWGGSLEVQGG